MNSTRKEIIKRIVLITLFSIAFGNVEAMVVVYLRRVLPPYDEMVVGTVDSLVILFKDYGVYRIEQMREMFTMIMLVSFSALCGKNLLERFAAFCLSFAVWDIFYYIFLNLLIDWPQTLFDIDVLFLIPIPWIAPVILPVGISMMMIGTSFYIYFIRLKKEE
ncbi:MAG: hypothetical protein A3C43_00730 [Candidatus Schekmanbacteria bacterium RIFCSPHIGHO2_02_FULL_38_11]|uniref:Uncharacterized protein n=1 Tax=Candidatus Schekmanbacteria bacterium RIFCSPLOWO2_12_FULL_38_15 TaxID=1817883 RepID=A0A1F7SJA9_9BACT|nr:MAG: hypothetical protein A2043_05235 [Candidatus Schekmanbacteria bacterium GWA2_38_9]OGL51341.1 MAG: hypothetical protein A3H37_00305 [Candidatus Schekmanbacteria bacterium RIFCSPLOWO2_02_FULL_38_14]OGL53304.1 MAG: hypothetical protein A3G31_07275 [Candidatus Schekmanbacteria bacterium RIFCSPLOWO2_12_FULL_38_15]OGL55663.1 MAG: hypothetical protein A3C43_00730 [Candidatus Schekmanbacteria bacterium RIFCSPHIGHO2_02_FULL_38_11]